MKNVLFNETFLFWQKLGQKVYWQKLGQKVYIDNSLNTNYNGSYTK